MPRKLLVIPVLMLLSLVVASDQASNLRSQSTAPLAPAYVDDGNKLPTEAEFARLAATDATAFLEASLRRQRREVQGYCGQMAKQETIDGTTHPPESIDFWFREEPYSVLLKWKKGARLGVASLFVEGENDGKMLAIPRLLSFTGRALERDVDSRDAKATSRYSIRESSLLRGTERTWRAWKAAREQGTLHVEYLGIQPVPELGNRLCHVLKRTCETPEEDGIKTVEIAVDAKTWLQIGTTLTDGDGGLIGRYMFHQLTLNPEFADAQFTRQSMR